MPRKPSDLTVDVDGHRLKLTHLEKVLYPETGTTKADVLQYYSDIAEYLLPYARDRATTRKRWVNGVGTAEHPGQMFFQKNLDDSAPSWVKRRTLEHSDHDNTYPLVNDRATLTWLAQIAALELHVPQWRFGPRGGRQNPDRLVLDLDPGEGVGLAECVEVAKLTRAILQGMGLEPMPVTSGSKGIHLYAALDGSQSSDQVSAVCHELARALEADHPDLVVSDMKKSLRVGKVLLDWSQNNGSKTTVAPYSLRGRSHPTVAAPRTWRELASPKLEQLDFTEVLARVKRRGDPLAVLLGDGAGGELVTPDRQTDADSDVGAGAEMGTGADPGTPADRLHTYRSMRDAAKTPEPVPDARPEPRAGNAFVIQKHDATRLHYDFRLEHDGVLVSWAIPKGPPSDVKVNHLAVQTEDHPIEYATFAGTIPKGEYGGGTVEIWDEGTFDLEKWRDGKEVIATLHGTKEGGLGGDRRFALIHTGSGGGAKAEKNWLIHRMELKGRELEGAGEKTAAEGKPQGGKKSQDAKKPQDGKKPQAGKKSQSERPAAGGALSGMPADPVTPMFATLGSEADLTDPDEWAYEMKWDGIRAVASVDESGVRLSSRNGNDVTGQYPDVIEPLRSALGEHAAILDGEIVAFDTKGRPDFSRLQRRMNLLDEADVTKAARAVAAHYLVFDILNLDGRSLLRETYDDRRVVLDETVAPDARSRVQVPHVFDGDFDAAFESSRKLGLEGVMAKRHESTYGAGRRSRAWIKIKHHLAQEVVVGGWRPGNGRRADGVGSLLLGIPDGERLRYVGRVGTGFSDSDLRRLAAQVETLARSTSPFIDVPREVASDAHWVEPTLVGEVEFAEWTASDHLRQPSWRGWRTDKAAAAVVRES